MKPPIARSRVPADLTIPPRPQLVEALMNERSKESPDIARMERLIAADIGVAGALVKTANSPLIGARRRVTSLSQAFQVLGTRNIINIASGLVLRYMMKGGDPKAMDRLWDSTEQVAILCGALARRLRSIDQEEAYSYGLFHDCGIPVLMLRYPDYREVFAARNARPESSYVDIEDELLGTNHAAVGSLLARNWCLSDEVVEAIQCHHDITYFTEAGRDRDGKPKTLIALAHLAEYLQHRMYRQGEDLEWRHFAGSVLAHFGLSDEDVSDLADEFGHAVGA